ncbi:MAG: hypothetical protein AAFP85_08395 [Pseudomonadota bacterium]
MEFDFIFVLGLLIAVFSVPSFASAYADKRRPSRALLLVLIGGGMIYYAIVMNPGAYSFATVDDVILRVIGWILNE